MTDPPRTPVSNNDILDLHGKALMRAVEQCLGAIYATTDGQMASALELLYQRETGRRMPDIKIVHVLSPGDGRDAEGVDNPAGDSRPRISTERKTIKSLTIELLESEPAGALWTFEKMLRGFDRLGIVLPTERPKEALRTTIKTLEGEGRVERVSRGTYRLVSPGAKEEETQEEQSMLEIE